MKNNTTILGVAAAIVGLMLVFGGSLGSGVPLVHAGISVTPDPTRESTCVPGQTCPTVAPTQTPGRLKTRTPTATPTAVATQPPATEAATNTVVVATSTPKPTGGSEGALVRPPDTGSGDGTTPSAGSDWLLVLGALFVVLGGGVALVGVRQRR